MTSPTSTSTSTSTPTLCFAYGSNLSLSQMQIRCPKSTYYGLGILYNHKWIINERGYANIIADPPSSLSSEFPDSPSSCSSSSPNTPSHEHPSHPGYSTEETGAKAPTPINPIPESSIQEQHEQPKQHETRESRTHASKNKVYGLLYTLTPSDEHSLDMNEGVPYAYTKTHLPITVLSTCTCTFPLLPSPSPSPFPPPPSQSSSPSPSLPPSPQIQALTYIDILRTTPSPPNPEYVHRMNRGIRDAVAKGMEVSYVRDVMRVFIPEESEESGVGSGELLWDGGIGGHGKKRGRWTDWLGFK